MKCKCSPNFNQTEYSRYVVGVALSGPIAIICTMLIHWEFSFKYWSLSYRLESIQKHQIKPDLSKQFRINRIVIFNIFFWPLVSIVAFPIVKLVSYSNFIYTMYFVGLWVQVIVNPFSCYILWNAFNRIRTFSATQNLIINDPMMRLHLISYILFIFSMFLYLFVYAVNSGRLVSIMTIIVCLTNLLSQVILVHVFI